LVLAPPPKGSETTERDGLRAARKLQEKPRRHVLQDFWWVGQCPYRAGDVVVQILDEDGGRRMVSPPGNVVHTRVWRGAERKCTFVYVELSRRNRIALARLAKRMGRGAKKRLHRGGRVNRDFAERLLAAWNG
jgi:hypothetical protein